MDDELFTVTDLKQYTYCRRILYYHTCLSDVRPTTYKMEAGREASEAEQKRAARRSLGAYQVVEGERRYEVPVVSTRLRLSGLVDEVVEAREPVRELVVVDYKLSKRAGDHFKLQLAAYAEMLGETWEYPVKRGYLLLIPLRRFEEVPITRRLRAKVDEALAEMFRIADQQWMPPPVKQRKKCAGCEFRRFCNDVR